MPSPSNECLLYFFALSPLKGVNIVTQHYYYMTRAAYSKSLRAGLFEDMAAHSHCPCSLFAVGSIKGLFHYYYIIRASYMYSKCHRAGLFEDMATYSHCFRHDFITLPSQPLGARLCLGALHYYHTL